MVVEFSGRSWGLVGAAALMVFVVIMMIMLRFMPQPRQDSDYVVVGAVATMGALAVFLLAFLATRKSSSASGGKKSES